MFLPLNQNTVDVCNETTLLILYCISSGLVTFLKVTNAPLQVPDIFYLTFSFKFISFSFHIFLLFFSMKCLLSSRLALFRLSTMLRFGSCNNSILNYSLTTKNREKYSPNHGLCCWNSYRPKLSLDEVLIVSLMFSQAIVMSSLSFKFSKSANLFEILSDNFS